MARPVDWWPLADGDPVPGDPYEVAQLARLYADTGLSITEQAAVLRRLTGSGAGAWDSDAGRAFAGHAHALAGDVEKAHERYATASAALAEWVHELESAQADADAALVRAQQAAAEQSANAPLPPAPPAPTPPSAAEQQADQSARARRAAAYEAAGDDLAAARRQLEGAVDRYHEAGRRVASKIRDAADHDGLADGFWDRFKGWIHDHADVIRFVAEVAGAVAAVAAALSLVLGWVPILGEALVAVAVVATAVQLVGNTLLALAGDGSWVAVGLDLVALASFGAAGLVTRPLEAAAESGEAVAGGAATAGEEAATAGEEASGLFGSYLSKADELDLSTEPDTALFYSGGNGTAREAAEKFADESAKTTLERTPGGRWLDEEKLFERDQDMSRAEAAQVWAKVSSRYAREASGEVEAFVRDPSPNSIFLTKELPILEEGLRTGRVTRIVIHDLDGGVRVLTPSSSAPEQLYQAGGAAALVGATGRRDR